MKSKSYIILIAILTVSSFLCGFTYRDFQATKSIDSLLATARFVPSRLVAAVSSIQGEEPALPPVDAYWSVYNYVDANYYGAEKPKPTDLTYAAIRGMLASLGDRYTRFLDPDEHKEMQQENRGDFEGIGAELDVKEGRVYVKKPIKNSPAIRTGIKAGDIILKVDDHLIQGLDIIEVVKKIRGPRGTKVKLTIKRDESPEPIDIEIVRDTVPITIVESRMEDDASKIGYIALRQFNEKSDQQFDEALRELQGQGMRGLVFDLRGNPGGLLDVAVYIGSKFIRKGDIVIVQDKGGLKNPLPVLDSGPKYTSLPLAVLVDNGSASASEIVAGAIRDHKAGTLVGTDTFGKGLIQTIINLADGSAVSITTAKYLTPGGHDVAKEKVHPDIVIEPTDEDMKTENDVQLKRAVQILKERLGANQADSGNRDQAKG